jgi:hypothetical protein
MLEPYLLAIGMKQNVQQSFELAQAESEVPEAELPEIDYALLGRGWRSRTQPAQRRAPRFRERAEAAA